MPWNVSSASSSRKFVRPLNLRCIVNDVNMLTMLLPGNKFLSATFTTEQYQQNIAESLAEVEKQSENLIDQAQMSSNYEMSHAMREVLSRKFSINAGFSPSYCTPLLIQG